MIRSFCCLCLVLVCSTRLFGAEAPAGEAAHLLQSGDTLLITVHEHKELDLRVRVGVDGTIRFPHCGTVKAAGQTCSLLADTLSEGLKKGNIERPQVFVYVDTYVPRYVYVLGALTSFETKAIKIPPGASLSALQAVSASGGFGPKADLTKVFVLRKTADGKSRRLPVNVRAIMSPTGTAEDVAVLPGDTVVVPTVQPVSVLGVVEEPGSFDIDTSHPVTVTEMLSRAGGLKDGADRDNLILLRRTNGQRASQRLKMEAVMSGQAGQDLEVQTGDVIIARPMDKIFVLGQVRQGGGFDLQPGVQMTITRAIALAGGFAKLAAEDAVLLVRGGQVKQIDLRRVLRKGGDLSQDQSLVPGDIVFVSESRW